MSLSSKAQHFSYKTLFLILILLLIPIVLLLRINQRANPAAAGWFNDGWSYRKAINIGNTGATQTNSQIKILSNSDLSALVTTGKLQANLNDLRFTDINGKTFNYWIEDSTNNSVDIWGLIPSIPTGGATIYMYYGNPSASAGKSIIGTANFPGITCKAVKLSGATTDNIYYIDPNGESTSDAYQAYCDLNTSGGGWTMLIKHPAQGSTQNPFTDYGSVSAAGQFSIWSKNSQINYNQIIYRPLYNINFFAFATKGVNGWSAPVDFIYSNSVGTTFSYTSSAQVYLSSNSPSYSNACTGYTPNGGYGLVLMEFPPGGWCSHTGYGFGLSGGDMRGCHYDSWMWNWGSSPGGGTVCPDPAQFKTNDVLVGVREAAVSITQTVTAASPSTEEVSKAPVAYWSFDEGVGTTVYDSSSNRNNGVFGLGSSAPTWQTEDMCISGKCLKFDGSNDYINTNTTIDNFLNNGFTLSAWVKSGDYSPTAGIISNYNGAANMDGYTLRLDGNDVFVSLNDSNGGNYIGRKSTQDVLINNKWHHIVATWNGTLTNSGFSIYVDGIRVDQSDNNGGTVNSYDESTDPTNIGRERWAGGPSAYFNGFIDEPKIYPYARSAAEVKADYNAGKAHAGTSKGSSANLGTNPKNSEAFSDGLVGYWKMDEAIWNGSANEVVDSSGNGNHGVGVGSTKPTTGAGKFGNGGVFDGISQYVDITDKSFTISQPWSFSMWQKIPNGADQNWAGFLGTGIGTNGGHWFYHSGGILSWYQDYYDSTYYLWYSSLTLGTQIPFDQWFQTTVVNEPIDSNHTKVTVYINGGQYKDSTTMLWSPRPTTNVTFDAIGGAGGRYFQGSIDETRIYNRALSPTEVKQLYEWAPGPVVYYNLDEGSGNNANDTSGNNYTGTATAQTSIVTGKYGKARKTSNANGQIAFSAYATPASWTAEAWVLFPLPTNTDGWRTLLSHNGGTYHHILVESGGEIGTYNSGWYTSGFNINTLSSGWHHVAAVGTSSSTGFYIDGVLKGTALSKISTSDFSSIGNYTSGGGQWFGTFDEVKIYNYALTSKQIVSDMNAGHPNVGSPVGSAVAWYKFDEGYGTTANNSGNGGSSLNITLGTGTSAPAWTNNGKFGKALSFNPSESDLATLTDPASLDLGAGKDISWSAWIKLNGQQSSYSSVIHKMYGTWNDGYFAYFSNSYTLNWSVFKNPVYQTWSATTDLTSYNNQWIHLVGTFTHNDSIKLYLNGKLVDSQTVTGDGIDSGANFSIGGNGNGGWGFNGLIDDVKIYNYALTSDEVKLDYNQGSSLALGSKSTEEAPKSIPGLTLWLDADAPSTITQATGVSQWNDKSGSGNNVVQATGSKQPAYVQSVLNGKPVLRFTNASAQTMTTSTNFISPVSVIYIARQTGGTNGRVLTGVNNNWLLGFWGGSHAQAYFEGWVSPAGGTPSTTNWYIESAVETGALSSYYENGVQIASNAGGVAGPNGLSLVGMGGVSEFSDADIAEIVVYNRALSDAERQKIEGYLAAKWGLQSSLPSTATYKSSAPSNVSNSSLSNYCVPGDSAPCFSPVAEWNFDEGIGTTAFDTSGNVNNGGWNGTGTHWDTGKYGKAGKFNGSDDYVGTGISTSYNPFTIEGWFKMSANAGGERGLITKYVSGFQNGLWTLEMLNGNYLLWDINDGAQKTCQTSALNVGSWYHATAVYTGSQGILYLNGVQNCQFSVGTIASIADEIRIGYAATGKFLGLIDQVKIYNYARSPAQIAYDYNKGAPVAWYNLDECQGTTIHSTNTSYNSALDGTLVVGATGSQNIIGTCALGTGSSSPWGNGATGKINSSLNFDGNDDYVGNITLGSTLPDVTISAWIKINSSTGTWQVPLALGANPTINIACEAGDNQQCGCDLYNAAANPVSIGYNNWTLITCVKNSSGMTQYINGKYSAYEANVSSITNPTVNIGRGRGNEYYTNGQIDDVQIYNYALTATQIKTLYNGGSVNFR